MNRYVATLLSALLVLCAASAGTKPNIVVMLSDDLSWTLPGFNGGKIVPSPNLDRLAEEGMLLTQFYVQSVCSPTRASFLTGRYPFRTGVEERPHSNDIAGMLTDERTLADALTEAGYFTAIFGKWHLGNWQKKHLPMQRGFQYQYGHYSALIDFFSHEREGVMDWHRNEEPLQQEGYSTYLIADEVDHLLAQQDKSKPFFFYVPFNAVHGPFQAPEEVVSKYRHIDSAFLPEQFAQFECLDIAVGRVMASLEKHGFAENTLVVFFNDNGAGTRIGNGSYKGGKGNYYEGALRVPCIFRWPKHIAPNRRVDVPTHAIDLYPTLINAAGASLKQELPIDGLDLWQTITKGEGLDREEIVHCLDMAAQGKRKAYKGTLRHGDFKLVGDELYNIKQDPYESKNVANDHPEKVSAMKARLKALLLERRPAESHDPIPNYPPVIFGEVENRELMKKEARRN
ncbi:Arylsulfatase [Pontiella sulfatireligans]|uniref:Arylsulfatase n=2 Tax=Pontiella sulfatireligans TaxID=2750658 RepID=A0A6C2UHP1_9BACT|nr:sulfatase S1_32 [Kiritimatiellales bacterium]VGO18726.1 Arylsulfatase [Pontiella sulfatireligans]